VRPNVGERVVATKESHITKERQTKLFSSSPRESAEAVANKWLASNAGKVKVYDIVHRQPNTDDGVSCIEIVYCNQPEPRGKISAIGGGT
jgi:hypothetical protein